MSEPEENTFTIREIVYPQDFPSVLELWGVSGPGVQLGKSDTPAEIEKKLKRDPDLFLVAETRGQIVGAVLGGFDGRRGLVYHLAVRRELRGQGLGTILMDEIERRLRSKGCIRSYLLVTKDNPEALDFYDHRGWKRMDLHVLAKDL